MESAKTYDLLCVGSVILDCLITGFDPKPISATGYYAGGTSLSPGGEALNQAVTASRLGLRCAVCSALGDDAAGAILRSTLDQNGVSTEFMLRRESASPITVMFVKEDGDRRSITNDAHRTAWDSGKCMDALEKTGALSLGSLFRIPFLEPEQMKPFLNKAHELGIPVYADTKLPNYLPVTLEDYREILPLIDYITPNETEARYCSGREDPEDMAEVFLKYGVKNVIIKLGPKGCYFRNETESYRLPACRIQAVDATGAGDSFAAGFITARSRGAAHEEALRYATACAAVCTLSVGATTGLHSEAQVLEMLAGAMD